jgi:SAM-dependent methyltransferase
MLPVTCLGCENRLPEPFLDIGVTPLANALILPDALEKPEETFPLAVAYCPICYLVQLTHRVPPEKLFSEYLYFSSYSESFLSHAKEMAAFLIDSFRLNGESRVLEIASNDGYLLQYFKQKDIPVLGVEPAKNIAEEAKRKGIPTIDCFFGPDAVLRIREAFGPADVVIGNNVLAHVPAINDFLKAVKAALAATGVAVFEFPYLKHLLDRTEFDTIYHEHVFYYSLSAIEKLSKRADLELFDATHQTVHGGSLRVFLQNKGTHPVTNRVGVLLDEEKREGLTGENRYQSFSQKVIVLREELRAHLYERKQSGNRIAAYGAPAKGNTLLNYCGMGTELIDFTVDRSPYKQGRFLPGSRIPILSTEALTQKMPEFTVILPWNIADEIIAQQQEYLRRGGRFIIPIPKVKVVAL